MRLQETFTQIMKRPVSIDEAKELANDQFCLLAAYFRKDITIIICEDPGEIPIKIIEQAGLNDSGIVIVGKEKVLTTDILNAYKLDNLRIIEIEFSGRAKQNILEKSLKIEKKHYTDQPWRKHKGF